MNCQRLVQTHTNRENLDPSAPPKWTIAEIFGGRFTNITPGVETMHRRPA